MANLELRVEELQFMIAELTARPDSIGNKPEDILKYPYEWIRLPKDGTPEQATLPAERCYRLRLLLECSVAQSQYLGQGYFQNRTGGLVTREELIQYLEYCVQRKDILPIIHSARFG
jgi:hypothetical protein